MKLLEPQVMEIVGMEAMSTAEVADRVYEAKGWRTDYEKSKVYAALKSLWAKGDLESRMCQPDGVAIPTRYWALPGGAFPKGAEASMSDRILSALTDEPMSIDVLLPKVYPEYKDRLRAMQNLNKVLNRLRESGKVERTSDVRSGSVWLSTWRKVRC